MKQYFADCDETWWRQNSSVWLQKKLQIFSFHLQAQANLTACIRDTHSQQGT
jgi:hypothetical protein